MKSWITKSYVPAHKRHVLYILATAAGMDVWDGVWDYNDDKRYVYYNSDWNWISIIPSSTLHSGQLVLEYEEAVAILEAYIKQQLKPEVEDGHP